MFQFSMFQISCPALKHLPFYCSCSLDLITTFTYNTPYIFCRIRASTPVHLRTNEITKREDAFITLLKVYQRFRFCLDIEKYFFNNFRELVNLGNAVLD